MKTIAGVIRDLGGGNEIASGNIFFRVNELKKAGEVLAGHKHNFDHTTFFWSGKFKLRAHKGGALIAEEVITAPQIRLILADVEHEITALEDNSTFMCVYAHRNPQGLVIERCEGYREAYV